MNEELRVIISAEIDRLRRGLQDARDEMSDFQRRYEDASENVDENFQSIGEASVKAMKTVGVAIAGAVTALVALGASTEEYRENQAKLNTAFESAGASVETAKNTYNDLYRVLGESDVAVEAANHLAKLTTNEKELSEWTNICQGVYATFGDSLPIEGLTEAANETAKVGTVTGSLADALNWAGISEDEFNLKLAECNTESERQRLIRESLNDIYDEAADAYEKNNEKILKQHEAEAKLQETMAKLGETVQPVVTAFTSFANDALAVVVPHIQSLAEKYMPILETALKNTADALGVAMGFLSDHWQLLAGIGGVIAGIAASIGLYNTVAAVKAAMDAAQVTTLGALVSAYAAQAAAMLTAIAPYAAVVAAITAVIAIIVLCVKHWDEIKETVTKVAKSISDKVKEMVSKVTNFFSDLKGKISSAVENIKTAVTEKFESIKNSAIEKVSNLVTSVKNKFGEIKAGITEKINAAKEAVKLAIDKIKGFFNFEWSLPKLKMPKISITGKFSLNPIQVPKFSIAWNKLGGIFDKPTLFSYGNSLQGIGEDGAEAVVPLEKNTKWLDRLATMLSDKQAKVPIVLQVDGKTFAQVSIDSINQLTKQTGSLGLRLV